MAYSAIKCLCWYKNYLKRGNEEVFDNFGLFLAILITKNAAARRARGRFRYKTYLNNFKYLAVVT